MKKKNIPLRKCVGCGEMKPKNELRRIVRTPPAKDAQGEDVPGTSEILIDATGRKNGRGVYICKNIECFRAARKGRRLERAFSCRIPDEVYAELEGELTLAD